MSSNGNKRLLPVDGLGVGGAPGEGRSRGGKVLNTESGWENNVSSFLAPRCQRRASVEGHGQRGVSVQAPGLAMQMCREQGRPWAESLPRLQGPAVP